ncbi:Bug family tripartite tricarboxylate transporter substrate binding protein [Candidatus Skiveiella danica]|jgi:tripartite-type tricarboxylate transporter receptor subunit TctC|uniref:Bug family tripartite tricarboxylate transporter substrate binding protein n=1 Tax=Candidatus Skiveiella danica TaxID=3386177 RepID=UPI0009C6075C|nr:MAG: Tripartite tricarboxylate transporter family receptor [Alphaproteobacteria bacterium ADurb.Bin100]
MRRRHLLQAVPLAVAGLHLAPLRAQPSAGFPDPARSIRWVVPFPAGGTSDIRARQVAEHLRQDAGWNVVVDNRPGASGMIGSDFVAKAPADGYTLLLGTIGTLAINPAVFPSQPYNVLRDFQPVTQFSRSVSVLMAHKSTGITSLAQIEAAVRGGSRLAYASTGTGTIGHMVGEIYKTRANLDITHVPYKGTAPAVQDFVAGHVPLLYETSSAVWEHLKAGTAVPLAVTSSVRMPQMPSVPTFKELGYADLVFDTWQGVVTTRGVPPAVLEALNREIVKALRSPDVVRSHEEQVNVVVANTPRQFERFIADETRKWASVVKETGVAAG